MLYYDLGKGGNGWSKQSWARHDMGADAYLCCPGPSLKDTIITRGRGRKVFAINTAYPRVIPDIWMGLDKVECYDRGLWGESFVKVCRGNYTDMELDGKPVKYFDNVFFASIAKPPEGKGMLDLISHEAPLVWHKNTLAAMFHLIIKMGAKNIYLVGCDMGGDKDYYDDRVLTDNQRDYNRRLYRAQVAFIKDLAEKAKTRGINIISSTYITPLNKFLPYKPLDVAIKESEAKVAVDTKPVIHCLDTEKKIAVIVTTRGDRPQFLEQCTKMIEYQTKQPDKVYIIDRLPVIDSNDQRDRIEEGIALAKKDSVERIIIMEDDDYYPPNYIESTLKQWKQEEIIGSYYSSVYYLKEKKHIVDTADINFKWNNNEGAALHSTCFTISLWDKFVKSNIYRKHKNLDQEIWQWAVKNNVSRKLTKDKLVISMKHRLGMCGCNHNAITNKYISDNDSSWLKENVNEIFHDFYINKWNTYTKIDKPVIMHCNNYAELGGIETTVLDIAKSMPEYQHVLCTVRTNAHNANFIKYIEEQGVIHQLGMLEDAAAKYNPEVIFLHNTHLFKKVLPGYKLVSVHHGVQRPYSTCDHNWFVSDHVLKAYGDIDMSNCTVLPPPVYPNELLEVKRPDRKPVVGRIQSATWARMGKTTNTFYDCLKQVKGFDYFVVGLDVPEEFPSAPIQAGKMAEYLSKIDIMAIWGDTTETWSKVVTEANLSGIPVVVRNHNDGLAEQLRKSGGGILVNTPQGFIENIQTLVDDKELRDSIAAKGKAFALANSTTDRFKEFFSDKVLPIINMNESKLITPSAWPYLKLDVPSAWKGLENYLLDIINKYNIDINIALEFGVERGYSSHILSQVFKEVIGVDTFEGDIHSGKNDFYNDVLNIFKNTNVEIVKSDFKDFIKTNTKHYDLVHIDIVHTYQDTYEAAEWAIHNSDIVILHDTLSFTAVGRVCKDLAKKYNIEYNNIPYIAGLGILYPVNIYNSMNITIYTFCYNEEYYIPYFVKHYKDKFPNCSIIIHDNESTDSSVDLAEELGCKVIPIYTNNQSNELNRINIKNNCWKTSSSKWNIIVDIDEFCNISEQNLIEEDKLGVSLIRFVGYDMINLSDDPNNTDIEFITNGCYNSIYNKVLLVNKDLITDINYKPGAHRCCPTGVVQYSSNIYNMYHYKYIGENFIIQRHIERNNRRCKEDIKTGRSVHYAQNEKSLKEHFNLLKSTSIKLI